MVAAGVPADTPVSQVMTAPATTIADDVTGADALLDMLDRGVRHLPVVNGSGRVVGVISDTDLMAVETRTPFLLRRAISAATTVEELAAAVAPLSDTIVGLHDAKVAAASSADIVVKTGRPELTSNDQWLLVPGASWIGRERRRPPRSSESQVLTTPSGSPPAGPARFIDAATADAMFCASTALWY